MSEIQNISEQIAKMKRVVNQLAQFLWDCNKLIDKHTLAIHNQLAGSADRSDRMVIDTLNAAQRQLNRAADDLLSAWTIAADWLERVGGGSSSSAPASAGPIFLSSGDDPVRTEVTQESDSGESDTDGTVRSGDDPVQTEATQGNDGVGSDTAGSKPIKFKLSPTQTEATQESDSGEPGTASTVFSGDDPVQTEATQGNDGVGSDTAGSKPIKFKLSPTQTEATQGSDGGESEAGGTVRSGDDPDKDEARKASRAWKELLSEEACKAIEDYSRERPNYYKNINATLRGLSEGFDPGNEEKAKLIHDALQKASLPVSMTVYRRGSESILGPLKGKADADIVGAVFRDFAFISTSMTEKKAKAGNTTLRIRIPKGCHAANIERISVSGSYEEEILIDGDQYFVITGVSYENDKTIKVVDAEMIGYIYSD